YETGGQRPDDGGQMKEDREVSIRPPSSVLCPPNRISRLTLTNFRSYRAAQVEVGPGAVIFIGPNGAGKTNLIEAISFFAPGRGLRRATLEDVAFSEGDGSWAVSADVEGALGLARLGTGIAPAAAENSLITRQCRIDREGVPS